MHSAVDRCPNVAGVLRVVLVGLWLLVVGLWWLVVVFFVSPVVGVFVVLVC